MQVTINRIICEIGRENRLVIEMKLMTQKMSLALGQFPIGLNIFEPQSAMRIIETGFEGLFEIEPAVFGDQRGYFFESYRRELYFELGIREDFVQDNESYSVKGTLRGLHYQTGEYAQAKLVRVIKGKVLDVALDIRKDSPTFGKFHTVLLEAEKHNLFLVPAGFAHGFVALEDSIFFYKCSNYYNKASEGGILWNDPALNIDWGIENPIVSEKDKLLPNFAAYKEDPAF